MARSHRDVAQAPQHKTPSNKPLLWIAIIGAIAAVGATAFTLTNGHRSEPASVMGADQSTGATALLSQSHQHIASENWLAAKDAAARALLLSPTNERARQLEAQATREHANHEQFSAVRDAVRDARFRDAMALADKITEDSVYHKRVRTALRDARGAYVKKVAAQADKHLSAGDCDALDALVQETGEPWPVVAHAAKKRADRCGGGSAAVPVSAAFSKLPYRKLLARGRDALKSGSYKQALRYCRQAISKQKKNAAAHRICGIAACNLKDAKLASEHLSGASRGFGADIVRACNDNGIDKLDG